MKFKKENYRNFTKNLLIYMAGEAPKMEYQPKLEELDVEGLKDKLGAKNKPLTGEKFAGRKKVAERMINKINLDADRKTQTQPEKELIKNLLKHNSEQFALLEHNYEVALAKLGAGGEKIKKAQEVLNNATHEFLKNLKVHIFKESMEQGTTEARGEMIDSFLKSKGVYMKGFGKYLVKGNWDKFGRDGSFESAIQNLKTDEEISKKLEEFLSEEKVLEGAIWAMKKDLPKFEGTPKERNYFQEQFKATKGAKKDRLTYYFGENNQYDAANTLAHRFHINFKKDGKPEYIVDLTTNKVYQPDSKEWQAKLKRVCHRDLKNEDHIKRHDEGVANLYKKREAKFKELLYGKFGSDWEVHKFSRLKENPLLAEALRTTKGHYEQINKGLNSSLNEIKRLANGNDDKKTGWALDHLTRTLTPEKVRASGLLENLAELVKMIQEAVSGKNPDMLNKISKNVEGGKNPAEIKKAIDKNKLAARKNYEKLLEFKKPKLDKLLELYQNPGQSADQFFQMAAGEKVVRTPGKNTRTILQEHANAIKYRSERKTALKNYMESHLKVSGFSARPGKKGILVLQFKVGDKPKTFYLKKVQDKYEVSSFDDPDKKTTIGNDLNALATALAVKAPAKVAKGTTEKKETASEKLAKQKTLYAKTIKSLISLKWVNGPSTLGKLLRLVKGPKKLPRRIKGNRDKKQFELDKARAKILTDNLTPALMKALDKNPVFSKKMAVVQKVLAKKGEIDLPKSETLKVTEAQPVKLDVKVGGLPMVVSYNPSLKRLILKHPLLPILFNEKGKRTGYVGAKKEYVFAAPPNGWDPKKHPKNLNLDTATLKKLAAKKKELLKQTT